MDARAIFETAKGALLHGESVGQTLFVELANNLVVAPLTVGAPLTTAAERQCAMMVAGRAIGSAFPGDTVCQIGFVYLGWECKILPGQAFIDAPRTEALLMSIFDVAEKRYSSLSARSVPTRDGKGMMLLEDQHQDITMHEDTLLDAALVGYDNAHLGEAQFVELARKYVERSAGRVGDAWGTMKL